MKKQLKVIPEFANEEEERKFWEQNDSSDYLDWNVAQPVVMPNLKYLVIPAKAGIQGTKPLMVRLDPGLRRDDGVFCLT